MNCARNIITANFGGGTSATTAPLWQWDYGQVLCITGIEDLPAAFEVHFSTNRTGGVSTVAVGADGQVTIPNGLLTIGKNLNAWIYLSDAQGEGETEYSILIPVKARPMPETYDAEVSGEFDDVVRQVSEYAETAQAAADNAGASASAAATSASEAVASASAAETAKNAAQTAQGKAEDAQAAAETAAQTATQKAQQTAQDADQAAQSASDAESAAQSAEAAQTGAESAKTDAETAAQDAADSASAASASATSAGQAASAAAGSASAAAQSAASIEGDVQIASQKAAEAQTAAGQAVTAKDVAQTAQSAAETAAGTATASATTATTKASEAAQSASSAAQSKTDAEAAATRAETAAATLTVDDALSDVSKNPVQNKVVTESVTQVKSAIDEIDDTLIMSPDKNLIDVSTLISGYDLINQQGVIREKTGWYVTDWIEIEPNTTYTLSGTSSTYRAEVDSTKTTYTGSNHNTATFTTGANSKYVRFNSLISGYATPQLEKGSVATAYAPYKLTSARLKRIESEMFVPDGVLDNSELVSGAYVSASTGAVVSNANYSYVKAYVYPGVKATYSYYGNSVTGIAFYDIGENCLASYDANRTTPIVLTVPDGAYIVKATVTSVDQITFDRDVTDMKAIAVDALGGVASQMFVLPSMSVAVIGHEWNLYYDNVFRGDVGICDIVTACSPTLTGFKALDDCIRVTPGEGQDGTYTVTLTAKLKATGATLDTQSFTLHVLEDDYALLNGKKVIFIGDSLTNAGIYPAEIEHNLSHGNLVSLGTLSITVTLDETSITVHHEGRSGWSANDYITKASDSNFTNAFWNPGTNAFDFSYYMTEQGYTGVDVVCINLGTNGYNTSVNAINTMIESILDYDSNIIIIISLVAPPATQDGCGNYNLGSLQNAFDLKRSFLRLDKQYMDAFQDNASLPNVFVSAVYFNLDRRHDFPTVEQPLSSRNPAMVTRQNNNVHPSTYGYLKFADVYYNYLLYHLGM